MVLALLFVVSNSSLRSINSTKRFSKLNPKRQINQSHNQVPKQNVDVDAVANFRNESHLVSKQQLLEPYKSNERLQRIGIDSDQILSVSSNYQTHFRNPRNLFHNKPIPKTYGFLMISRQLCAHAPKIQCLSPPTS